jgi:hypothetical protein
MLYDLNEDSIKKSFIGEFPNTTKRDYLKKNIGPVLIRHGAGSNFMGEYLSKLETEFESILQR